jgi:hypothetical protein
MGGLVEQHLEDVLDRQVEGLASEEDLAPMLATSVPAGTPPVTQLHEPSPFDTGAKDDYGVRQLWMVPLHGAPAQLSGGTTSLATP